MRAGEGVNRREAACWGKRQGTWQQAAAGGGRRRQPHNAHALRHLRMHSSAAAAVARIGAGDGLLELLLPPLDALLLHRSASSAPGRRVGRVDSMMEFDRVTRIVIFLVA